MIIQDILNNKGNRVITTAPHHTLYLALCTLAENKVGALVVKKDEQLVGIITERDLMRAVYQNIDLRNSLVESLMTRNLITAAPDHQIEFVMTQMTENRFRHMPILEDGALVGIISIGDLVKAKLVHTEDEVMQYKDYVALSWHAS
jgi:CBS domain-containing protein